MMGPDKANAIQALVIGADFAMVDGEITVWNGPGPQPTDAEITAKLEELQVKAEIERYRQAVQSHIDATARSRDYRDGFALAGYVNSAIPPWKAEAEAFIAWRDQVWLFVFEKLSQIQAGNVEPPESPQALIGWLPVIEWSE
jgi:hypothetical protein